MKLANSRALETHTYPSVLPQEIDWELGMPKGLGRYSKSRNKWRHISIESLDYQNGHVNGMGQFG